MKDGSISPRGTPPPDGDLSDCDTEVITDEETGDDSGDATVDLSVVKIMSDDPMAAARAAAILKMVRMYRSFQNTHPEADGN